jgi:hypothetical protein
MGCMVFHPWQLLLAVQICALHDYDPRAATVTLQAHIGSTDCNKAIGHSERSHYTQRHHPGK